MRVGTVEEMVGALTARAEEQSKSTRSGGAAVADELAELHGAFRHGSLASDLDSAGFRIACF